jgi:hypothetical protein
MVGAPRGSISACHPSGWVQADLFTEWFDLFFYFVKPSADDHILLIVVGHYSYTKNLDVLDKARERSVVIVSLPSHSTHKMKPLDVGLMEPLKIYYAQETETWLKLKVKGRKAGFIQHCSSLYSRLCSHP